MREKMRKIILFILLGVAAMSAQQKEITKEDLKTDNDKTNYAIGFNYGSMLKDGGIKITPELFLKGFIDGMNDGSKLLEESELEQVIQKALQQISANMNEKAEKAKFDNKDYKEGTAFLEENKKKEGVITTKSGLQYKIVKKSGKKQHPTATQTVKVNYEGKLLDGKVFDSSYERKEPISFPLNRVIPGWTEGVQLMSVGDKFEFYIPQELAYGSRGAGAVIPPYATLIFTVELLAIEK
jgi:FKBP-type peptidyl-prolyl cis-trans isomerase